MLPFLFVTLLFFKLGLAQDCATTMADAATECGMTGGEITDSDLYCSTSCVDALVVADPFCDAEGDADWAADFLMGGDFATLLTTMRNRCCNFLLGVSANAFENADASCWHGDLKATLSSTTDHDGISGDVYFMFNNDGTTTVTFDIMGLDANSVHGIHIHTGTDVETLDGSGCDGHFNPFGTVHGCPDVNDTTHVGDMGSITADSTGHAVAETTLDLVQDAEILERCIILHELVDSCTGDAGDAGERFAMGLIESVCTSELIDGTLADCGVTAELNVNDETLFCSPSCIDSLSTADDVCGGNPIWGDIVSVFADLPGTTFQMKNICCNLNLGQCVLGENGETAACVTPCSYGNLIATMETTTYGDGVSGEVDFSSDGDNTIVDYRFSGLIPESGHTLHIHAGDDIDDDTGLGCGDLFNPFHVSPGCDDGRRVGDIGNIWVDENGVSTGSFNVDLINQVEVTGRCVILHVHATADNCQDPGDRIAMGIIERACSDELLESVFSTCGLDATAVPTDPDLTCMTDCIDVMTEANKKCGGNAGWESILSAWSSNGNMLPFDAVTSAIKVWCCNVDTNSYCSTEEVGIFVDSDCWEACTYGYLEIQLEATIRGGDITGKVLFLETDAGTQVTAEIWGLGPNSENAIHIHEGSDVEVADGSGCGGHFNPFDVDHACPDPVTGQGERHVGDMGTLIADADGYALYEVTLDLISSVETLGRCVVLHEDPDSCEGTSGNAGARLARGLVISACTVAVQDLVVACAVNTADFTINTQASYCSPACIDAFAYADWACVGNHIYEDILGDDTWMEFAAWHKNTCCNIVFEEDNSCLVLYNDGCDDVCEVPKLMAELTAIGDSGVSGTVYFEIDTDSTVTVSLEGLEAETAHGIHIHKGTDAESADGLACGGHFNPFNVDHECPDEAVRHVGDMGSVTSDGSGVVDDETIELDNLDSVAILGRCVILHADHDNCENPSGNAGVRLAQGIITVAPPDPTDPDDGGDGEGEGDSETVSGSKTLIATMFNYIFAGIIIRQLVF